MKVGILTFHSQLNYGGVLQCWALKTALEGLGHEVVVVDRWLTPANEALDGPFGRATAKEWSLIVLRAFLGCGQLGRVFRHWRTRRFVRGLTLTKNHFYDWSELNFCMGKRVPTMLDEIKNLDCLVVGSDQVWHGGDWGWPTPRPYLLEDAPKIHAIAYAASFGMKILPPEYDYASGFRRFSAISVREKEGIELVGQTGYPHRVEHVIDPTLLLRPVSWRLFCGKEKSGVDKDKSHVLLCYFVAQDLLQVLPILEKWARKNSKRVRVLCDSFQKPFPRTFHMVRMRIGEIIKPSRVKVCAAIGPREFVREFASANDVITDSFHAVMFSSIFGKNCRFLKPHTLTREVMFSRIDEFAKSYVKGPFFSDCLIDALHSLLGDQKTKFDEPGIGLWRLSSRQWLESALKESKIV